MVLINLKNTTYQVVKSTEIDKADYDKYEFFNYQKTLLKSKTLCSRMVDCMLNDNVDGVSYYNYGVRNILSYPFENPIDSFRSLLIQHSLLVEETVTDFFYPDSFDYVWLKEKEENEIVQTAKNLIYF